MITITPGGFLKVVDGGITLPGKGTFGSISLSGAIALYGDDTTAPGRNALVIEETTGNDPELWFHNDQVGAGGFASVFAYKAGQSSVVSVVPGASRNYWLFEDASSGQNPEFRIYGYDTGASAGKYGILNIANDGDFYVEAQSGESIRLRTGGLDTLAIGVGGNVAVVRGNLLVTNGQASFDQSSSSAAIPVLKLDQADVDDTFINFIGTSAADGSKSISLDVSEDSSKYGAIRVEISGLMKWIRIYDNHS